MAGALTVHAQHQRTSSPEARRTGLQSETGHAWLTVGQWSQEGNTGQPVNALVEAMSERPL